MAQSKQIFAKGSKTFYTSSLFFPKNIRDDIIILYAFVRVADDYVDSMPQNITEFTKFQTEYKKELRKSSSQTREVIKRFVQLQQKYAFEQKWVDAFFDSMKMDTKKHVYQTMNETCEYIYGSAQVIGLFMAKILDLPKKSYSYAEDLGFAFQYINMIRDVAQDLSLQRQYIPQTELRKYGLNSFAKKECLQNNNQFVKCIRAQIDSYLEIQQNAKKGFRHIPYRYRVSIATASDSYEWTAKKIYKDPFIIFEQKVKPTKLQILYYGLKRVCIEWI